MRRGRPRQGAHRERRRRPAERMARADAPVPLAREARPAGARRARAAARASSRPTAASDRRAARGAPPAAPPRSCAGSPCIAVRLPRRADAAERAAPEHELDEPAPHPRRAIESTRRSASGAQAGSILTASFSVVIQSGAAAASPAQVAGRVARGDRRNTRSATTRAPSASSVRRNEAGRAMPHSMPSSRARAAPRAAPRRRPPSARSARGARRAAKRAAPGRERATRASSAAGERPVHHDDRVGAARARRAARAAGRAAARAPLPRPAAPSSTTSVEVAAQPVVLEAVVEDEHLGAEGCARAQAPRRRGPGPPAPGRPAPAPRAAAARRRRARRPQRTVRRRRRPRPRRRRAARSRGWRGRRGAPRARSPAASQAASGVLPEPPTTRLPTLTTRQGSARAAQPAARGRAARSSRAARP